MSTHYNYPPSVLQEELKQIAKALCTPGKGILAMDESAVTMSKRFNEVGLENTEETRRKFRQLLITDKEIATYISGVILFHETVYQETDDGEPFIELLKRRGIIPGVKVDAGAVPLFGTENEFITQGLDDLHKRCAQYKMDGCYFTKWRCVIRINKHSPTYLGIVEAASVLARFAAISQGSGMVPIIEPAVLPEGDHSLERCQKVSQTVLVNVYKALSDHHVFLEGTVLKPSMVTQGTSYPVKSTPEQVGVATLLTLARTVPPAVPGIMFHSGCQNEEEATLNLNAINQCVGQCRCITKPWTITFSFGRALQTSALHAWAGKAENIEAAQALLLSRAKASADASLGQYVLVTHGDQT